MSILDEIISETRRTIASDIGVVPRQEMRSRLADVPPTRGFADALAAAEGVGLIAEVKRRSPSAGLIRDPFDPLDIATAYRRGGATCISVLTEQHYFGGHLDYLSEIRQAVSLPLLRKDFVIDEYQIDQARVCGADAVLLIAECLSREQLRDLAGYAHQIGLDTLVELYDPENLPSVLSTQTRLVGVNNRNLHTFETSLQHTVNVGRSVPADRLLVGESGIYTAADVAVLADGGVKAILVGESLMRQQDVEEATRRLLARSS